MLQLRPSRDEGIGLLSFPSSPDLALGKTNWDDDDDDVTSRLRCMYCLCR